MLIFLCQGGESTITVYAPEGSRVTASGGGEDLGYQDVPSGGSVTFKVHTIATWSLTCTSGSLYRETTKQITSFGQAESWTVSFAFIKVHTHPGASVTATKSGFSLGPYTADPNGDYDIPIPENAIDSTAWTVSANNGSVTDTDSVTTASPTAAPDAYPLWHVPIIVVTSGSNTWTFKGATIDNTVVKIQSVTSGGKYTGWKAWFRSSCSIKFTFRKYSVDVCAVGKGTGGSFYRYDTTLSTDYGGDGGTGGAVSNVLSQNPAVGTTYSIVVDSTGTSFVGFVSVGVGGGAAGGGGGQMYVSYSGPGSGASGKYAFNSSSFDNTEYGHGGYGGDVNGGGSGTGARGRTDGVWGNPGAGGAGGGQENNIPTGGNIGILLMRNSS